ncbi:MAG: lysozyme, partial [Alphaproteobacteria bacterium]|nr:lysozyme [Alphaproteobacteria bacterium]
SFTFNLGSGRLQGSTLRMKANRGDMLGAADEFPKWRRAGGRILRGLVRRRAEERALWLN